MKSKNYNYAFLFYDVGEKRVNKVFKICKKYLVHYQNSVFRGDITPSKIISLKSELKKVVKKEDFICIIKMINDSCFEEDIIGEKRYNDEDLIL